MRETEEGSVAEGVGEMGSVGGHLISPVKTSPPAGRSHTVQLKDGPPYRPAKSFFSGGRLGGNRPHSLNVLNNAAEGDTGTDPVGKTKW